MLTLCENCVGWLCPPPLFHPQSIASHYLNDVFPRPHKYPSFVVAESFAHNALQYVEEPPECCCPHPTPTVPFSLSRFLPVPVYS